MDFTLEKLKAFTVQIAVLLFMDFTTDNFWRSFQKLAVVKGIF